MGFEAMFPQRRLRHEAGESGNAQEYTAIDGIDLENNTVTLRSLQPSADQGDGHEETGSARS